MEIIKNGVKKLFGASFKIEHITPVHGGSINEAFLIDTGTEQFFLKLNDHELAEQNHLAEEKGLKYLKDHLPEGSVPEVIGCVQVEDVSMMFLEWIHREPFKENDWKSLAEILATMHTIHADKFGMEWDNFMGAVPQSNGFMDTWGAFWVERRIRPLMEDCKDQLGGDRITRLEGLLDRTASLFPEEKPCLIHGDLWSGNVMCSREHGAMLVDPAIYYGHREMDLAMTHLFGRFGTAFYDAYNALLPLEEGWQDRTSLCNLYPLLVHLKLFGDTYLADIEYIIRKFD